MAFDYFYGAQSQQFAFYRIPKVMFTDNRFQNISTEGKVLYGLLLDRVSLSMENGWIDDEGRVYIIFTLTTIRQVWEMLTFEKVLKVFQAYLDDDPLYEVVQTSHGYTLMAWEPHRNDWYSAEIQKTPEDLRNALLGTYANFLEDKITGNERELTVTETGEIQQRCRELLEKCREP